MKAHSFLLVLTLLTGVSVSGVMAADLQAPSLTVKGENIDIATVSTSTTVFLNRTLKFVDMEADFAGWQYVRMNAYSTVYQGGPAAVFSAKADGDGYFYCMMENQEKPSVCQAWAEAEGWQIVDGYLLSYGSGALQKLHVYRKPCRKGEWVTMTQPLTFSGAIVMAPSIKFDTGAAEQLDAAPVHIDASGWMETAALVNGTVAYANRTYTFTGVPAELSGLTTTRYNGGDAPRLDITALQDGNVYIGHYTGDTSFDPAAEGWTRVEGLQWSYTDGTLSTFYLYTRAAHQGDRFTVSTTAWTGVHVVAKEITYALQPKIVEPVPGTVVANSHASTGRYVGSPSITILPDGSYLASHDHFGSFLSDVCVYRSDDRGATWQQTATLPTLNWAKLFTRAGEVYLLGVQPRVNIGYGNIVILRSDDGGRTWTTPTDEHHGLLRTGYYHTSTTPVVRHRGRLWKGMENQESAGGWGPFAAFTMSAPEDADLLEAANWTYTNELHCTAGKVNATTWLEGNAVVAPDGSVVDILRLDYPQDNEAAVVHVSADGTRATFDPLTDIAHVPGATKKFTIRYDSISSRYWTLSNYVLPKDRNNAMGGTRNHVALCYSQNLTDWTIKKTILYTDDIALRGFQYLDWQFEGDDIVAVSRTAWPDEGGNANSAHNANYLTFHRIRNFRAESAATEPTVAVADWYDHARSALALTFDDGFRAHYQHVFPLLERHGIKGTFYLITDEVTSEGTAPRGRYGVWEEFRTMADAGHEIGSHTLTHPSLQGALATEVIRQMADSRKAIEEHIGRPCLTLAYPYCQHDESVDILARQHYLAARACGSLANDKRVDDANRVAIGSDLLTWLYPRSLAGEEESYHAFVNNIEQTVVATGGFGVACIHEVLPYDRLSESDTYEVATTEWLDSVCTYLTRQREAQRVWPAPLADIVRYAMERQNLVVQKTDDGDRLDYRFGTTLDGDIYTQPLTVDITAPAAWGAVECTIMQGTDTISSRVFRPIDGENVTVHVVPDRQHAVLVPFHPLGDLNDDYRADEDDADVLAGCIVHHSTDTDSQDFNGDGRVDAADLATLIHIIGGSAPR